MNKDIPVSACIIAQDEEVYIAKTVSSIMPYVSEVVVIDGGSKDKTVEICRDLGCNVIVKPFDFHFSNQRNFGASMCKNDWILWCDADEWFCDKFYDLLPSLVLNPPEDCVGYHIFRISIFDEEKRGEDFQWRLTNKNHCEWSGKIHEGLKFNTGKHGLKIPKEFEMYHEHTMNRQLYNNALYYNVNKGINERPAYNVGMESHDDEWVVVETDREA